MHEQQLDILDVVDDESLVAGGHHVAGLLVGAIADLNSRRKPIISIIVLLADPPRSLAPPMFPCAGRIIVERNVPRAWQCCP